MPDNSTFEMTLYFSNFIDAREITAIDGDGIEERGIFIPIKKNGLMETKRGKYVVWGFVQERDYPSRGFTHRIKLKTNPSHMEWMKSQFITVPIIGQLKPTRFSHRKRSRSPWKVKIEEEEY